MGFFGATVVFFCFPISMHALPPTTNQVLPRILRQENERKLPGTHPMPRQENLVLAQGRRGCLSVSLPAKRFNAMMRSDPFFSFVSVLLSRAIFDF